MTALDASAGRVSTGPASGAGALAAALLMTPRVVIQFAVVSLIWGSTWLVITAQLGVVPPSWSVAYRFLLAAVLMLALCLATGKPLRMSGAGHGFALAVGVLQFTGNFNFVYRSEQYLTSGLVAVVFALLVVSNALLARIFLKTRVTARFMLGGALGIAGVLMMFGTDLAAPAANSHVVTGLILVGLGVVSASGANVLQATRLGRSLPIETALAWGIAYGALLDTVLAWSSSGPPVFDWHWRYLAGLVYLAVIATVVAFSAYYSLIRSIGPARAAYTSVVTPVVALSLSMAFEHYRWTALAASGAALALVGLVVALRSREVSA